MAAKRNEQLQVQLVGIKHIMVDPRVQSRVKVHAEFIHEFSEAILRGDVFPAVDVFFDGKEYWLADGFHRVEACRKARINDVRCAIRYGTRRDAIIFSAGSNLRFSIPRSAEDKKRAVYLLLSDPEWFNQTASSIGRHAGVGFTTVQRYRTDFCTEKGVPVPSNGIDRKGKLCPLYTKGEMKARPKIMVSKSGHHSVIVYGRRFSLGYERNAAEKLLDQLLGDMKEARWRRPDSLRNANQLGCILKNLGVPVRPAEAKGAQGCAGVLVADRAVVAGFGLTGISVYHQAVGLILLARKKHMPDGRAVILCYGAEKTEIVSVAAELGVEFMTPEEFAKGINPKGSPQSPSSGDPERPAEPGAR